MPVALKKKRDQLNPFTVVGRLIGHGSGWDQVDDYEIVIYDFVPLPGIDLPECDLSVSFNNGHFSTYGATGNLIWQADIIDKLKDVKR